MRRRRRAGVITNRTLAKTMAENERLADRGLRHFAGMFGATDPQRLADIEAIAAEHEQRAAGHSFAAAMLRETLRAVRGGPS